MKKSSILSLALAFACATLSAQSLAGTVMINTRILSVTIIGPSAFGHIAGNMEIRTSNGAGAVAGVTCTNADYVTTKAGTQSLNQSLSLLIAAQASQKTIQIGITDDATKTGYPGRCSLVSVTLL